MLVSVVMPAWRAETTIRDAVQSLIDQSLKDWELIIAADDGEDYKALLAEQGLKDQRISCYPTPRPQIGPAPARNHALKHAQGEIVANLDADDAFAPDRLAMLAPLAAEHGAAIDAVAVISEAGQQINTGLSPEEKISEMTAEIILGCGAPLHSVFRRHLMPGGWPDVYFCDDVVMNLELRSQAPGFKLHKAPLYRYHVRADSICHRPDAAEAADTAYRTVIDTLKEGGFRMTEEVRNLALEGFEQRRRTNAAFAVAQAAGEVKTFQDFLARQET